MNIFDQKTRIINQKRPKLTILTGLKSCKGSRFWAQIQPENVNPNLDRSQFSSHQ